MMELTIKGEPKEIAAFLLETGKRPENNLNEVAKELFRIIQGASDSYGFAHHTSVKR